MIRGRSSIGYILEALLPYSDANLKLVYKPHQFFYELERISNYKKRSLQNAFYSMCKKYLIEIEGGFPRLTPKGYARLQVYKPEELQGSYLMIIFDIPESERNKRQKLRLLLRELKFKQVQKSVWITRYDCRNYLKMEVEALQIKEYVEIFESRPLKL